jgi:GNAT superfamily N-acetyltransferase
MSEVIIRPLSDGDSIADLTELLHRAYGSLAAMGLRFFATHQTVEQTLERIRAGRCFVATLDARIVGTITLYGPNETSSAEWYRRHDIAYFGQFAIEPALQRRGLGTQLLAHVEGVARGEGVRELLLDTAEPAQHLIDYYARLGFDTIGHVQWRETNYRSVIMSKPLSGSDRAS